MELSPTTKGFGSPLISVGTPVTPMTGRLTASSAGRPSTSLERLKKEEAIRKQAATGTIQRVIRGFLSRGHLNDKFRLKLLNLLREWSHGNMLKLEKRRDLSDRSSQALLLNSMRISTTPSRPRRSLTSATKVNRYINAINEKRRHIDGLHNEVKSEYIKRNEERAAMSAEDRWGNFRIRYDKVLKALIDQDVARKLEGIERERLETIKRQIFEANKNIIEKFEEGGLRERMERETMFREEYTQRRREDRNSRNAKERDQLDKEQMTWEDGMGHKRREAEREQYRQQLATVEDRERIVRAKLEADKASVAVNSKGVDYATIAGGANKLEVALRERFRNNKANEREECRSTYCQILAQAIAFNPKVARIVLANGVSDVNSFNARSNFVTKDLYRLHKTADANDFIVALYQFMKSTQFRSTSGLNINRNYSSLLKGEMSLKHAGIMHPKMFNSNQRLPEAVELKKIYDRMNRTYFWWRKERRYRPNGGVDGAVVSNKPFGSNSFAKTTKFISAAQSLSPIKTDALDRSAAAPLSTSSSVWNEVGLLESCREVRVIASVRLNNRWYRMNENYNHSGLQEGGLDSPSALPKVKKVTSFLEAVHQRTQRKKNRFINEVNLPGVEIPKRHMQVAAWLTVPEEVRIQKDKVNTLRLLVRQRLACFEHLRDILAQFRHIHGDLVKTIKNLKVLKVPTRKQRLDLQDEAIRLELKLPKLRAHIIESCRLLGRLVVFNCIAYIDLLGIIRPHEVDDHLPSHTPEVVCNFSDYKFAGRSLEDSSDEEPEEGLDEEVDEIDTQVKSITERLTASNAKVVDLKSMTKGKKHTITNGGGRGASKKGGKGKSQKVPTRVMHDTDSYIPHSLFPVHPPLERSSDVQPIPSEKLIRLDEEQKNREEQAKFAPSQTTTTASQSSKKKHHHHHHHHKDEPVEPESTPVVVNKELFSQTIPSMGSTGPFIAVVDNVPSLYGVRGCGMYDKQDANEYDFVQWCMEVLDWYSAMSSNWLMKYEMLWKERHIGSCLSFVHRFRHVTHGLEIDDVMLSENTRTPKIHRPKTVYDISPSDADLTYKILYRCQVCDLLDLLLSRADITVQMYDPFTQQQWSRVLTGYEADRYFGRHPGSLIARFMYRKGMSNEKVSLTKPPKPTKGAESENIVEPKKKTNLYGTTTHKHKVDRSSIVEPIATNKSNGSSTPPRGSVVTKAESVEGENVDQSFFDSHSDPERLLDHMHLITKDDLSTWHQSGFIRKREQTQPLVPCDWVETNAVDPAVTTKSPISVSPLFDKIQKSSPSKSARGGSVGTPSSREGSPSRFRNTPEVKTVAPVEVLSPSPTKVAIATRRPHTVSELCEANMVTGVEVDVNLSVMKDKPDALKRINPALIALCPSLQACHNDKAEQCMVQHVYKQGDKEPLYSAGQACVYNEIDIDTAHYDESILSQLESKAMERERAELLEFVTDVIVRKQGMQLYETYEAFKAKIHNKATLKTAGGTPEKTHAVSTGESHPILEERAESPHKAATAVKGNSRASPASGAVRDRSTTPTRNASSGLNTTPPKPKPMSTAAVKANSHGVVKPKANNMASPHKPNLGAKGSVKHKVVLETAKVTYRLRINKHGATPALFLSETKSLVYWHCRAPNWMMPFYHWGAASAPEPFWRKLLLETEFNFGDGTGKYATLDVLNRKIDNIAKNVMYRVKFKRLTYLAKLDVTRQESLKKINQECMEYEDARSGAAAAYEREQAEKRKFTKRVLRILGAVSRVLFFPCMSSPAAKVDVVPDPLVKALSSLSMKKLLSSKTNDEEPEFIPSVWEWRRRQTRLLLRPPPPGKVNLEEITKETDLIQKTIALSPQVVAEIKVQSATVVRWELPETTDKELSSTFNGSPSKHNTHGHVAGWITDHFTRDGATGEHEGKSHDRDELHDPDPEVVLGNAALDDAATVITDSGSDPQAFRPAAKEGWVCGGMTGVALMTRSVVEPKRFPRGQMWVSAFNFDTSTLGSCLKQVHSNVNIPQTAALVARVGFLSRPLCHNNGKKFASVLAESGRLLAGGRTYRHLSCEVPTAELPRLRDLTRSMLWTHVVNDRYDMKKAHVAVLTIQKLYYVFQAKKERLAKEKAKENLKIRLKKEHEAAKALAKATRENEERSARLRERTTRHRNSEDSTGFFSLGGSVKRRLQNDGNSVIGSLLGSMSGKHRGGRDSIVSDLGDEAPSKREIDPTSFVGSMIGSLSGKHRGRRDSNFSDSADEAPSKREIDPTSFVGSMIGSLSGKHRGRRDSNFSDSADEASTSSMIGGLMNSRSGKYRTGITESPTKSSMPPNLPALPAADDEVDM